jgi:MOSC domain-containing protein YiiM
MRDILQRFPTGEVVWIGLSPGRKQSLVEVQQARVCVSTGFEGDHHARKGRGSRQVTLIQAEHLAAVGAMLGRETIHPREVRRNLCVRGINIWALQDRVFRVGEVLLKGTGPCNPCARMEEALGPGGYLAMRGHGGITASVLEGGALHVGDPVVFVCGEGTLDAP